MRPTICFFFCHIVRSAVTGNLHLAIICARRKQSQLICIIFHSSFKLLISHHMALECRLSTHIKFARIARRRYCSILAERTHWWERTGRRSDAAPSRVNKDITRLFAIFTGIFCLWGSCSYFVQNYVGRRGCEYAAFRYVLGCCILRGISCHVWR